MEGRAQKAILQSLYYHCDLDCRLQCIDIVNCELIFCVVFVRMSLFDLKLT